MGLSIALIGAGFLLLIFGANWLVSGATALAKRYHISDLDIGLTIVAFGTSAPELVVNGIASADGLSDIVYGNIIGSNMFNIFVILGIVGLILPIAVQSSTVWKEIPLSLVAAIFILLLSQDLYLSNSHTLSRIDAFILLICFGGFLWYVSKQMKNETENGEVDLVAMGNPKMISLIVFGIAFMIGGGKLVVDNAVIMATTLGVSEKIIGLTILAAGTSLPELVTSMVAALKKNSDIAIGNVIGSNIFNILLILPISALINPVEYNVQFDRDIYLLIGGTIFLFVAMFTGIKWKLDRWEAGILLIAFVGYTVMHVITEL